MFRPFVSVKRCEITLLAKTFSLPTTLVKSAFRFIGNDSPVFDKHDETSDDSVTIAGNPLNV
jgi:hypothetical protein